MATTIIDSHKYSTTARWLHWGSAALIIWATLSGLSVSLLNINETLAHWIADFNVSATLVFIPFFIWRVVHRLRHGMPAYGEKVSAATQTIAVCVHCLLYGLTSVVLLSGVLMMDRPFSIFYLVELQPLISAEAITHTFEHIHVISSRLLGLLVALHIVAVIKHQLGKTGVLQRMW